jgi:hypothetical protein
MTRPLDLAPLLAARGDEAIDAALRALAVDTGATYCPAGTASHLWEFTHGPTYATGETPEALRAALRRLEGGTAQERET